MYLTQCLDCLVVKLPVYFDRHFVQAAARNNGGGRVRTFSRNIDTNTAMIDTFFDAIVKSWAPLRQVYHETAFPISDYKTWNVPRACPTDLRYF